MQGKKGISRSFLAGGGEMGEIIRSYDWNATPLGAPESWPQGLKTSVRLLLSTGHPMFLWWGPELIQFYNDAYRRSIGPERHPSALGQRGRECWGEIWDVIEPQIEQVMAGKGHTWHENQLVPITRHGRREDVYWTYSYGPIDEPSAPSGIGGVLVVCTETTEQLKAEQRLKAAEARWRSLFNQAPGFMAILRGPEHTFEFANPRFHELVSGREIIGRTVRESLPEFESQGFVTLLDNVYRSGEAHSDWGAPLLLAQGSSGEEQRYVDFVYEPVRDDGGRTIGILIDGYDVTDRVSATAALREEDRRKDEFLAMLAHELRSPLAPILNASELLTRSETVDADTRAKGDIIARQVTQLSRLVDDLLDVSRVTTGRIELQKEPVELGHAIDLAIESVQPLFRQKQQEFHVQHDILLYVEGDLARLVQCISNVLTNANKYTGSGGDISIALRRDGEMAVIDVTDKGAGIATEMLPKVFDLFVQDNRTLDRSQGGLGIGLAVVQRLMNMHGGQITALSEGRGQGSTFRMSMPLIEIPVVVDSDQEETKPTAKRVLVVDDNVDSADSLAQLLRHYGHEPTAVYSGEQALRIARELAADVVLLDIGLPEMDGYEVARRLRAQGHDGLLVAVTGYGQEDDIKRAHEAGFDVHMTKPVALDELQRTLQQQRTDA